MSPDHVPVDEFLVLRSEQGDQLLRRRADEEAIGVFARNLRELLLASPLGQILAAGLLQARQGRDAMNAAISQSAAVVIHELERYLSTLGTIAAITPLLGLLGTVIGMIRVFTEIMVQGTGNPNALAGGISEALITTAAGLCVAIPAYACHRFFVRRVDTLVLALEQESAKLVDAVHGDRRVDVRDYSTPKEPAESEKSA
jgi:biopolymer transport protein ExbB